MADESLAAATWAEWLKTKKWDYWMTGTLAGAPSEATADRVARSYLAGLGVDRVYAAVAVECGGLNGRPHVHMLIGGLGAHPDWQTRLRRWWLWGDLQLDKYDPAKDPKGKPHAGASAYLSKHPDRIEIVGTLRKWRPRR